LPSAEVLLSMLARLLATALRRWLCAVMAEPAMSKRENMPMARCLNPDR
jgi:hypothetical protein